MKTDHNVNNVYNSMKLKYKLYIINYNITNTFCDSANYKPESLVAVVRVCYSRKAALYVSVAGTNPLALSNNAEGI